MDDDDGDLVDRVHGLSDLELAILLSLVRNEHCVIGTPESAVDDLVGELGLVSQNIFGLRCAVVDCHADITLEDFATALLQPAIQLPAVVGGTATTISHNNGIGTGTGRHVNGSAPDYFQLPPVALQSSHTPSARSPRSPAANSAITATAASTSAAPAATTAAAPPLMANIVVARHMNFAPDAVQIQALELLRTRRIFTPTAMQASPKPFLLIAVVAAERGFLWDGGGSSIRDARRNDKAAGRPPHMTAHLNDFFSMGHWHDPDDGFPNLEEGEEEEEGQYERREEMSADSDSVVRPSESGRRARSGSDGATISSHSTATGRSSRRYLPPSFSDADIDRLAALSKDVRVDVEVLRYQMNVVAFLRMHRAVAVMGPNTSGLSCVSPAATKHFEKLAQCLAPLHRLNYVTPALVALAARKTYLHRIRTVPVGQNGSRPEIIYERSMQWGSEKAAVQALLEGVSPEDVIEDVLGSVVPPV